MRQFLCGALSGICNGLFGAGGGNIAVYTLGRIQKLDADKAHASAILIMLPLTAISLSGYVYKNVIPWDTVPFVAPSFFVGSIIGAKMLGKLKTKWLNRIFAFLMLLCAVFMVVL